ncbi:MAG: nucleotidyl transferase AbiEii/AbiGii toxin family protein [Burkholderiales bacterium]
MAVEFHSMPLDTRWLSPDTLKVFQHLRDEASLAGFTLIGGSALALQIGHRMSQDLDFYFPGDVLPQRVLRSTLAAARAKGFTTLDMLSPSAVQQTRINHATDLHDWVQDWSIGGVKVSFSTFEGFNEPMHVVASYPRVAGTDTSFSILGIEGLFAAKAALLARRVRSRDLFDLKALLDQHGYSIRQLFAAIRRVDPSTNPDIHRDVLRGLVPLDADDEGFAAIGVQISVDDLYRFFRGRIDAFEREEAKRIADDVRSRSS